MMVLPGTQTVVTLRIGNRRLTDDQDGIDREIGLGWMLQAGEDILDMLGAQHPGFEDKLDGDQHGFQAVQRHGSQHPRHDPVAAFVLEQAASKPLQRLWHVSKRRAITQGAGLAFGAPLRNPPGFL